MNLYIANASQQNVEFFFRVPESIKRRQLSIPSLSQIKLEGMSKESIDLIVEDNQTYGFVAADDVSPSRSRRERMASLCYSIDKPVPASRIDALLRGNHEILDAQGRVLRQQAAVASNEALVKQVSRQSDLQDLKVDIDNVELTIQQDFKGDDGIVTKDGISEGMVIDRSAKHGSKTQSRRSRNSN